MAEQQGVGLLETSVEVPAAWVTRYLALLGVDQAQPTLETLGALTHAHFREVGFENITSQLRRAATPEGPVPPIDHDAMLRSWEERRGGGVCYELAWMFGRLLEALGFDLTYAQGQISFPGSHQALVVTVEGHRYLVDMGCGAPLFAPIALNATVEVHHAAGLSYRFVPDADGNGLWQERLIQQEWTRFCHYDLRPASEEERDIAYQRHHTYGESWVLNGPRMIRCFSDRVAAFGSGELVIHSAEGKQATPLGDQADYLHLAAEVFRLPDLPIAEAVAARAKDLSRVIGS